MTTKPEIVAYMRPAFGEVVSQQEHAGWEHDAFRNPGTKYGEYSKNKALEYSEPLICLKDYEALQAECDALRAKTSLCLGVGDGTGNLFVHGDYDSIKRVQALIFECEKLREDAEFGRAVLSKREPGKKYGCHCDIEEGVEPDECVIDMGTPHHCIYAKRIQAKEQCEYWRVIASDSTM